MSGEIVWSMHSVVEEWSCRIPVYGGYILEDMRFQIDLLYNTSWSWLWIRLHRQIADTLRRNPILPRQHQSKILRANSPRSRCTSSSESADLAELLVRPRANLLRLLACIVALVLVTRLVLILTAVRDRASIAIVCVDAAEHATVPGEDVVDDDVASAAVAAAVAAGSHYLAVVGCVEVLDVERSFEQWSVILKNERVLSSRP